MNYKLGKLPARPEAVKFKLRQYIDTAALPKPPARFGHFDTVKAPWGMFANDKWGDCVWAGAAHETMLWHAESGKSAPIFTDKQVLSDYAAVTGFNYTDATDYGTDMQLAASYRRKTGVRSQYLRWLTSRHKIDSYLSLSPGNSSDLLLACYLFGAVGVGIQFPESAFDQFNAGVPWDFVPGSKIGGGHYIPVIGFNGTNILCITWGALHAMTPRFYAKYNDETIAYVTFDSLDKRMLSPEGFNITSLRNNLKALS